MPDASKLSFPLQLVILIVSMAITCACTIWTGQSGLRSDVRDLLTRQEAQSRLADERSRAMTESVGALSRQQQAQQYEIANIQIALATAGVKFKKGE